MKLVEIFCVPGTPAAFFATEAEARAYVNKESAGGRRLAFTRRMAVKKDQVIYLIEREITFGDPHAARRQLRESAMAKLSEEELEALLSDD